MQLNLNEAKMQLTLITIQSLVQFTEKICLKNREICCGVSGTKSEIDNQSFKKHLQICKNEG